MTTISVNKPGGITLTPASYTNPVVIEAGVTISNAGAAVYASEASGFFTVQNYGTIFGSTDGNAVALEHGAVTNETAGLITGVDGVVIANAGAVVNDGTISGSTSGWGVYVGNDGAVTNAAGGLIAGGDGVFSNVGVTVINDGSIAGTGTFGKGVYLGGGSVTNATSASIMGYTGIIVSEARTGTVVNYGTIASTGKLDVYLRAGGS